MLRNNLMAAGTPAQQAAAMVGIITPCSAVTSAGAPSGTTQANSAKIPSDFVILTGTATGSGTGYVLPAGQDAATPGLVALGDTFTVVNQGGNTLLVYPNTSTGKVQGGSAGAGFSVANNKEATFMYLGSDLWGADLSA